MPDKRGHETKHFTEHFQNYVFGGGGDMSQNFKNELY